MAQSQREILDFSPFGFAAKADASGVDLKVPPLRSVRMTRDVWVNYYIIAFCFVARFTLWYPPSSTRIG